MPSPFTKGLPTEFPDCFCAALLGSYPRSGRTLENLGRATIFIALLCRGALPYIPTTALQHHTPSESKKASEHNLKAARGDRAVEFGGAIARRGAATVLAEQLGGGPQPLLVIRLPLQHFGQVVRRADNAKCCQQLKTRALLDHLAKHGFDAAFGGARRDEEKSRAKERFFSVRDEFGQWDPKNQRPELWNLYNANIDEDESVRVFPLSNWTELDVWQYIKLEDIPIVPLYFAQPRKTIELNGIIIPCEHVETVDPTGKIGFTEDDIREVNCRFRSLGCIPCTGAVESDAQTIDDIIAEVVEARRSERENRIIDLTSDSSMEQKKREGYF